uniref:NADH-ubiquinone oxidoreductase chain 6 n=1 Tax=Stilpnonotus mexicanus TaxID=1205652 RepID=A0A0S2MQY2_9CUCU|nr:NADH deshydrogenase subunit 6 [Stilpnonotus mexicanus]
MLTTLIFLNFLTSMIFISLSHPLSLGMTLLVQTLLISLMTGNFSLNFWFSYIIFLILVGGMLILFIYMTSVASNEKFSFSMNFILPAAVSSILLIWLLPQINSIINNMDINKFNSHEMINLSINKYINSSSMMIFMFMIMYLFIALIATVKITNLSQGPLRQSN